MLVGQTEGVAEWWCRANFTVLFLIWILLWFMPRFNLFIFPRFAWYSLTWKSKLLIVNGSLHSLRPINNRPSNQFLLISFVQRILDRGARTSDRRTHKRFAMPIESFSQQVYQMQYFHSVLLSEKEKRWIMWGIQGLKMIHHLFKSPQGGS